MGKNWGNTEGKELREETDDKVKQTTQELREDEHHGKGRRVGEMRVPGEKLHGSGKT